MIIRINCNGMVYYIEADDAIDLQEQGVVFGFKSANNIGYWNFNSPESMYYVVTKSQDYAIRYLKNTGKYDSQFESKYENIEEEIQALEKKLAELKEKQVEANKVEITYGDAIVSNYGKYYFIMKKPGVGKPVGLRIDSEDCHCVTWVNFMDHPEHFKFIKVNATGQELENSCEYQASHVKFNFPE